MAAGRDVDSEGDLDWRSRVLRYRARPRDGGRDLLAGLGPWIGAALARLAPVVPLWEYQDLRQELLLEVLATARRMPLGGAPRWIPRRLVERASRTVGRRLRREARERPLRLREELVSLPPVGMPDRLGLGEEDFRLLYRQRVESEPVAGLAAEAGIEAAAMRRRLARLERRVRVQNSMSQTGADGPSSASGAGWAGRAPAEGD
ncbi:MAG: hypothetical protein ACREPA_10200 [Candidatus Dormibacteraceae bacterium]